MKHPQGNIESTGKNYSPLLNNSSTDRGELQHFLRADLRKPSCVRNDPRIGRMNPVDVGVDLASTAGTASFQRGRKCHCSRIRSAAANRRDFTDWRNPLKSSHHRDAAFIDQVVETSGLDRENSGPTVRLVGTNSRFTAAKRNCRNASVLEGDRHHGGAGKFAGGQKQIQRAGIRIRAQRMGEFDQLISRLPHRGNDYDHPVTRTHCLGHAVRTIRQPCRIRQRRPTEFLDQDRPA